MYDDSKSGKPAMLLSMSCEDHLTKTSISDLCCFWDSWYMYIDLVLELFV